MAARRWRRRECAAHGTRTVGLVAACCLLAAACGGVGSGGDGEEAGGEKKGGTLTTMGFGTGDEVAEVRADAAKAAIAPAKVKFAESAFNAQQFLSAVAAGDAPDLVYMDRQFIGTYANKGTLMPLTDCVKQQRVDMSQYREAAVDEVTFEGQVYGLPEFYNNRIMLLNDSALSKAGLEPSDVDTSDWDSLETVATKATKKSGKKLRTIGFDPKVPEFLPMWAKANGADLISADGKTANLDDPKVVEALEFAASLVEKQGGWSQFKSYRDSWDFFGKKNQFATDQLAAFPMEDWYINVLADTSPKDDVTAMPFKGKDGQVVDWVTGSAWAIPKDSEHKDQACTFIKTMTEKATWLKAADAREKARKKEGKVFTGIYTGNRAADEEIFERVESANGTYPEIVEQVLAAQDQAFALPASPAGEEFKTAATEAVNRVLSGQQAPEQALKQAQKEAQAALDKAAQGS